MRKRVLLYRSLACCAITAPMACDSLNSENGLLGASPQALPALLPSPPSSISSDEQASLVSLDRRNWDVVHVEVIRGQVEARPTYSENLEIALENTPGPASGSVRDAGKFPTVQSAMDPGSSVQSELVEGAVQPVWVAALFVAAPVRMAMGQWPWIVQRSPRSNYELITEQSPAMNQALWEWVEVGDATQVGSP